MTVRFHQANASVVVLEDKAVAMSLIDPIGALELGKERHQKRLREAEMARLAKLARGSASAHPGADGLLRRLLAALAPRRRAATAVERMPAQTAQPGDARRSAPSKACRPRRVAWPHPRGRGVGLPTRPR